MTEEIVFFYMEDYEQDSIDFIESIQRLLTFEELNKMTAIVTSDLAFDVVFETAPESNFLLPSEANKYKIGMLDKIVIVAYAPLSDFIVDMIRFLYKINYKRPDVILQLL